MRGRRLFRSISLRCGAYYERAAFISFNKSQLRRLLEGGAYFAQSISGAALITGRRLKEGSTN